MIDQIMYIQGVLDQNLQFQRTITKQETLQARPNPKLAKQKCVCKFSTVCTIVHVNYLRV